MAGAGIEGASAGGMLVSKGQKVVEEGLPCPRAGGVGSNSREVGGRTEGLLQVTIIMVLG